MGSTGKGWWWSRSGQGEEEAATVKRAKRAVLRALADRVTSLAARRLAIEW